MMSINLKKRLIMFGFLLTFIALMIGFNTAECSQGTYYSIHLESFKDLKRANGFVNTLTQKGKLVFWKKADVPGKGEFYRVYLGKYEDREKAVEFWNILNEEGVVNYFGVHEFKEILHPETLPEEGEGPPVIGKPQIPEVKNTIPVVPSAPRLGRFIDNNDGTVIDSENKLMWIKNGWRMDFFSAEKWDDAHKKCNEFNLGGYTDWRLPTIREWKSLLDPGQEYPALVNPNPFENIIVHMPYWSGSGFQYGSGKTISSALPGRAYTVMLYYGRVNHQSINKRAFIMPVRSLN
ncbi:DUF1566 domain-containing protein [Thermodesulfobacteriota bacterium]